MTSALLSQTVIEVVTFPDANPVLSQSVVEVIRTDPKLALLTQTVVEVVSMGREIGIGGRESINDDAYQYYGSWGCEGDLMSRESERLRDLGFDNWNDYLTSLGYSGNISDMKYQWLRSNGFQGSINDLLYSFFNS